MDINKIRCITFDLDDTLWECAPVIHHAESTFYQWLQEHYPQIHRKHDVASLTLHRRACFAEFPSKSYDFSWLRKRWLLALKEEFGCDDNFVDEGFQVFLQARNEVKFFDGVTEMLDRLHQKYICGSITNGNADARLTGIDRYLNFEITAAGAGAGKPDEKIFAAAINSAGVAADEILHVGDDAENDVRGAARLGMQTLWINPRNLPWQGPFTPTLILPRVVELEQSLGISS